ncbi:MAG: UDP-3-O-(3-hydroxymyristoyl)glucosamine N-acyltransferase [Verrucomicrobiota bacterium]|nr:UDP-3-O-(3-hydroxymyristoyl)glucosamine N-acyltransferase [Verrucomicrobiota bacterium]
MTISVAELARTMGGVVEGDGLVAIAGVAGVQDAGPGDITFVARPKYAAAAATTRASAIIVGPDFEGRAPCAVIRVKDVDLAFVTAVALLAPQPVPLAAGIHLAAIIAPDVRLGRDVAIGPYAVLEPGVTIGDRTAIGAGCYVGHFSTIGRDCRFYPHVTLRERAKVGNRVIIHNGAVLGSDGFGYTREGQAWKKIPQVGVVEVGDDVEIGANVTIDRARFGKTVIGNGVKLDNLIQVAHNARIGDHTAIAAMAGLAGSVTVGANCQIGGQAGIGGHIRIGDGTVVGARSLVLKDAQPGSVLWGTPAIPLDKAKKINAYVMLLPRLREKVDELAKRLKALEARLEADGRAAQSEG